MYHRFPCDQMPSPSERDSTSFPLPRPELPGEEDCCHSDCPSCVFTLYERELERWEQARDEWLRLQQAGAQS